MVFGILEVMRTFTVLLTSLPDASPVCRRLTPIGDLSSGASTWSAMNNGEVRAKAGAKRQLKHYIAPTKLTTFRSFLRSSPLLTAPHRSSPLIADMVGDIDTHWEDPHPRAPRHMRGHDL